MRPIGPLLVASLFALSAALPVQAQSAYPAAQVVNPTPTRVLTLTPFPYPVAPFTTPGTPFPALATPIPRQSPVPTGPRPDVAATATSAAATITTADATSTAVVGAPLTAVALTATALAVPTRTPTVTASPTLFPTATPSPTRIASPTVPLSPTPLATLTPTPDPLARTRTVLTTAPIAVGEDTLDAGTTLEIPLDVELVNNAIPGGTMLRLPSGQTVALPASISIPAVESPTVVAGPLNVVLATEAVVDGVSSPAGTSLVVPSGTAVLGAVEPNAVVLLRAGTAIMLDGRTRTLAEPAQVVVSAAPVARPATLPATGDADPLLWPAALGLALLLLGWRLRRTA